MSALTDRNSERVGLAHPHWKGGKRLGERGHYRISYGPDKHRYEHRVIVRDLMREWNFWSAAEIPPGFQVHHLDFLATHNCPCNLLLLERKIHQAFIRDYRLRFANGQFAPRAVRAAPDWVTDNSDADPCGQAEQALLDAR